MSRLLEEYGRERFLEGLEEGKQKISIEMATRMIVDNMPLEEIAEYVDIALDRLEELVREVKSGVDEHTKEGAEEIKKREPTMNDAEKLREIVVEYESIQEFNSQVSERANKCGKKENKGDGEQGCDYRYAPQLCGAIFSDDEAKLIDALTIPFDTRVKENAFSTYFEHCGENVDGEYTYRGRNKEYYEWLRKDTIRKISEQDDWLGKAWLIEEYGKQILEASKFFEIVEAVEVMGIYEKLSKILKDEQNEQSGVGEEK